MNQEFNTDDLIENYIEEKEDNIDFLISNEIDKKEIKKPILTNEECETLYNIVKTNFEQHDIDTGMDKEVYEEIEFFRNNEEFEINDFLNLNFLSFSNHKDINKKVLNKYIEDNKKRSINTIEYFKRVMEEIDLIVLNEIKNNLIDNINIIEKTIKPYYSCSPIFKELKEASDKDDCIYFYEIQQIKQKYFSKTQRKFETKQVLFNFFNVFCKNILNLKTEIVLHNKEKEHFKIKVNEETIDLLIKRNTSSHSGLYTGHETLSQIEIVSRFKNNYFTHDDIATLFHEFGHFYEDKILQNKKRFKINTRENYSMFFEFLFLLNDDINHIFIKNNNEYNKKYREFLFLEEVLYNLKSLYFIIEDNSTLNLNETNYLKFLNKHFYLESNLFTNYIVAIDNIINNRIDNCPIKLDLPKELLDNTHN